MDSVHDPGVAALYLHLMAHASFVLAWKQIKGHGFFVSVVSICTTCTICRCVTQGCQSREQGQERLLERLLGGHVTHSLHFREITTSFIPTHSIQSFDGVVINMHTIKRWTSSFVISFLRLSMTSHIFTQHLCCFYGNAGNHANSPLQIHAWIRVLTDMEVHLFGCIWSKRAFNSEFP